MLCDKIPNVSKAAIIKIKPKNGHMRVYDRRFNVIDEVVGRISVYENVVEFNGNYMLQRISPNHVPLAQFVLVDEVINV